MPPRDTQMRRRIRAGLRQSPRDPDLWVGLGNALVVHADGMMSPAAQLAFDRAARLAPDHPGPPFFYGLALAQGGQFDEAERIWRQLLVGAPAQAEYRRTIEERLEALARARAMGQIPPAAPAPRPRPARLRSPLIGGAVSIQGSKQSSAPPPPDDGSSARNIEAVAEWGRFIDSSALPGDL